ncbi:hypothetical protein Smp_180940 [Schistosoma mansoni]|uniref:hypothetical protein n=1 Tax=Schistosoma mansoni TaxID=6183 RepID=UPI00019B388F|nr:hypothetical protein Smp_180940 [Schistosoma mansoni]|eukprot:XP_018650392.1 hypothetical protein Smp_180940 [Schistosoma mansoni]
MRIIVESSLIILTVLQLISYAFAIKCRVCLPCEEKYKKLFQITKDEILHNCGVCITAYSTFQGYQMEGRGCLLQCPPKHAISQLTPGLVNKYDCFFAIKCRVCLPCEEKYKKLFQITKDEILHNYGVCITAYSTFQGYQMEGRGCLLQCPPKHAISQLTPGLVNKIVQILSHRDILLLTCWDMYIFVLLYEKHD